MKFASVRGESPSVSFKDALFNGIAPDGGLYVPEYLPKLSATFLSRIENQSLHKIGRMVASLFIKEIPSTNIQQIVEQAWNFQIPLIQLEENLFLLELFHGPTLAFKDVGARFMAHALSFFLREEQRDVTILVATSGDTGSAVAHGFFNVPHISVYILYPSGKISRLQEQQMTTLGGNIHAVEVDGTFDDCQQLVKETLADHEIVEAKNLTTANSINLGRLIPQVVYYVWAYAQWKQINPKSSIGPTVVVPSGNFGNLTAAVYAKWMGLHVEKFIAATNANDVVPEYFRCGVYQPRPSVQTYSNAMDVGDPSNLARLQKLYGNNIDRISKDIEAMSINDEETLSEIRSTYKRTQYILDPHTAVGVAAARKTLSNRKHQKVIVAATAHPAKFPEVINKAIGVDVTLPPSLQEALNKPKQSTRIAADYAEWKGLLLKS
jgi:threonine synthase